MLILMRHGQTTSNVDRMLDTQLPGAALTELGEEQARKAGREVLQSYSVDRVISSEALRARQTAALAFGEHFDVIPAVPGIKEVDAGRWEMQNSREAHEAYLQCFRGFYRREPKAFIEDGETFSHFMDRYTGAVMPYVEQGGTTVVVSHGGAIRAFAANATHGRGVTPEYAERSYLPNCSYVVLDTDGEFGHWHVRKWADHALP